MIMRIVYTPKVYTSKVNRALYAIYNEQFIYVYMVTKERYS